MCVTHMLWRSNTESVPLLVSNIHDIILVHAQYIVVCTCLYYCIVLGPVFTWLVPVCRFKTSTYEIPCSCNACHNSRWVYTFLISQNVYTCMYMYIYFCKSIFTMCIYFCRNAYTCTDVYYTSVHGS